MRKIDLARRLLLFKEKFNEATYNSDEELLMSTGKSNMDKFILQGILGSAYYILVSGVFLSGYLLYLGASDQLISYIPIIDSASGVFIVFFAHWIRSKQNRRKLLLAMNFFSKFFRIISFLVPIFFSKIIGIRIAFVLIIFGCIFSIINTSLFNTWLIGTVPNKTLGRYIGIRNTFNLVISVIIPIAASLFLDFMQKKYDIYIGFLALVIIAVILASFELFVFSKIDDVTLKVNKSKIKTIDYIKIPIKNKKFINFTIKIAILHLAFYTAASFHQVYMLKYLNLSYSYINLITIISPVVQALLFAKFWGILTDKINSGFVFVASTSFFAINLLLWTFVTKATFLFLLPIIQIVEAIQLSGFNIVMFNRRYEFAEEENRVVYDTFFIFVLGASLLLCPMLSLVIRNFADTIPFLDNFESGQVRFLFALGSLLCFIVSIFNVRDFFNSDESEHSTERNNFKFASQIFKLIFKKNRFALILILTIIIVSSVAISLF